MRMLAGGLGSPGKRGPWEKGVLGRVPPKLLGVASRPDRVLEG